MLQVCGAKMVAKVMVMVIVKRCFWWFKNSSRRSVIRTTRPTHVVLIVSALGVTLPRKRPAGGRIGEYPSSGQVLQVPLGRAFGLPRPEDPSRMLLVGIKLGINKVLQIVLVVRTQTGNRACSFAVTRADVTGARIGKAAVVACASSEAVEPLSAIGLGTRPFADDGPLVGPGKFWAEAAGSRDMVRGAHGNLRWREDLVLMGIEKHILVAR